MTATVCGAETLKLRFSVRERILAAATELFAEQGYENTSTISIARTAHTSETQLLKNFVNKQGLLKAVFAGAVVEVTQLLDEVQHLCSPRERLREFLHRVLLWMVEHPAAAKLLLLDLGRICDKNRGGTLDAPGWTELLTRLEQMLHEARALGQLKSDLSPALICSVMLGGVNQVFRDTLVPQRARREDEIDATLDYLVSCFLR